MQEQVSIPAYTWRKEPEISPERQRFLASCLETQPDMLLNQYPFRGVKLTRADVEWLLVQHEDGLGPVDWNDVQQRGRFSIDLRGADLRQVNLRHLPLAGLRGGLTRSEWTVATLEQRETAGVHLEGADLSEAHLEGAVLRGAYLSRATLRKANLREAVLYSARLEHTYLREAHLESANLIAAQMEGAYMRRAHLERADLRYAFFDSATSLDKVTLCAHEVGCVAVADLHWGDINLSVIDWTRIPILGDEHKACKATTQNGQPKPISKRHEEYRAVVRANRQLANVMRAQGMNEEAIPYAYRAQVLQRTVLWQQARWGHVALMPPDEFSDGQAQSLHGFWRRLRSIEAYCFSWFLDLLSGYGYKPGRSLFIYLLVIACFAICYTLFGRLTPLEALIFSLTSFHGRGFLPGPFKLGSPITALAALEAVMGLFIEISFIATFTQRFFGR